MKDAPPARPPEAATFPRPFTIDGTASTPDTAASLIASAVRGPFGLPPAQPVYCRNQGSFYFATANPDDSALFPSAHPLHPRERYDWFAVTDAAGNRLVAPVPVRSWAEANDRIKFGWLVDEDRVDPPSVTEKVEHAQDTNRRVLEYSLKCQRLSELVTKPIPTAAERDELIEIRDYMARMARDGVPTDAPGVLAPRIVVPDPAPTPPIPEAAPPPAIEPHGDMP